MWPLPTQLGARTLRNRWQDLPKWDAYISLTGLSRLAGTRQETIPADIPYLRASPALASLAPLFTMRRVAYVSLQKGERQAELAWVHGGAPILNWGRSSSPGRTPWL